MTELSPAAQAVLDAVMPLSDEDLLYTYTDKQYAGGMAAATLRAVADEVVPEHANPVGDAHDDARHDQRMRIRYKLLAIADELKTDEERKYIDKIWVDAIYKNLGEDT